MSLSVRRLVCAVVFSLCVTLCGLVFGGASALALKTHVLSGLIGEKGTGPGQFEGPVAVAVNNSTELGGEGAGDVYVADRGNRRVERFSATGAYLGQFDGTGTYEVEGVTHTGGAAPPQGQFTPGEQGLAGLAVDSSSSPGDSSKGDVYVLDSANDVVDRFSATGEYEGQLEGICGAPGTCPGSTTPFFRPFAVAVDPNGNVWVAEDQGQGPEGRQPGREDFVSEFSDTGSFITQLQIIEPITEEQLKEGLKKDAPGGSTAGLTFDSSGNMYEILSESGPTRINPGTGFTGFGWGYANGQGEPPSRVGRGAAGLAFDPATDSLLFAEGVSGGVISEYNLQDELSTVPVTSIGAGDFQTGWNGYFESIAANNSDTVYATEPVEDKVLFFEKVVLPDVKIEAVSGLSETDATLNAAASPQGEQVTTCEFEYVNDVAYKETGGNGGWHTATVVPCSQEAGKIPVGSGDVPVSAPVTGLSPGTAYDYRVRVGDASGVNPTEEVEKFSTYASLVVGSDSFSGVGPGSVTFAAEVDPGGRPVEYYFEYGASEAYGSVTPNVELEHGYSTVNVHTQVSGLEPDTVYHFRVVVREQGGGVQEGGDVTFSTFPDALGGLPDGRSYEMVTPAENHEANVNLYSGWPGSAGPNVARVEADGYRAAADGDAVAYESAPTVGGTGHESNQQMATRLPGGGWTQVNIQPLGFSETSYRFFSNDLTSGIVESKWNLTTGAALGAGKEDYYVWEPGVSGYSALPGTIVGASEDGMREIVEESGRMYEVAGGVVSPVGVLPEGQLAGTSVMPFSAHVGQPSSRWISTDGSRVIWRRKSSEGGGLFLRDMTTNETVQLDADQGGSDSGGGKLWTASTDATRVFFTSRERLTSDAIGGAQELYECTIAQVAGKLSCELADLTAKPGEGGNVAGVLGASENGEYVYFAAGAALAGNAEMRPCEFFSPGGCNLYLIHDGEIRLVRVLSSEITEGGSDVANPNGTAEVSSNGTLVFLSNESLTGYNNMGSNEIYVYEPTGSGHIFCASCRTSGEPPTGTPETESYLPSNGTSAYQMRWISEDGSRVFFDSGERLVARDTNGAQDVYEWERDGAGSCAREQGCVYLISSGSGTSGSYLLDASANGNDVFIVSRDVIEAGKKADYAVYDARVGGVRPLSPPACSGTGCQGIPAAPPVFATPSSVTFNGVGNFPPPTPVAAKAKAKSKPTKCKKGFAKKHGKCVRKTSKRKIGKATRGRRMK